MNQEITLSIANIIWILSGILAAYGSGLAMYFRLYSKISVILNDLEWLKKQVEQIKKEGIEP